jgi:hypothetical protein
MLLQCSSLPHGGCQCVQELVISTGSGIQQVAVTVAVAEAVSGPVAMADMQAPYAFLVALVFQRKSPSAGTFFAKVQRQRVRLCRHFHVRCPG